MKHWIPNPNNIHCNCRPIPNRNEYRYHLRGVPCIPKGKEGVVSWFVGFCAANIVTTWRNFKIFYVRFCWGQKKSVGTKCAILLRWLIISLLQNGPETAFSDPECCFYGVSTLVALHMVEGGPCVPDGKRKSWCFFLVVFVWHFVDYIYLCREVGVIWNEWW